MLNAANESSHLKKKNVNILITNACNLYCGGCTQHCDMFSKEEKWFIPLDQLKQNIKSILPYKRRGIGIFGGEPTLHPQWYQILELIASFEEAKFVIFSNMSIPEKIKTVPNAMYSKIMKGSSFHASMIAAKDKFRRLLRNKTEPAIHRICWNIAKRKCYMWRDQQFFSIVYDNKAYLCEPAAAIDRLLVGKNNWLSESKGWDIIPGKYVFNRTRKEIISQAMNFCYRCGCCTGLCQIREKLTEVSKTNLDLIGKSSFYMRRKTYRKIYL